MVVHWVRCRSEPVAANPPSNEEVVEDDRFWRSICAALGTDPGVSAHDAALRSIDVLAQPTMIILDDYETVTSPRLDMELLTLLRSDSNLYITVIARYVSLLDGPLVSSQITVNLVDSNDLLFTQAETMELAAEHGLPGTMVPHVTTSVIHGWPIAVNAALQGAARGMGRADLDAQFGHLVRQQISLIQDPLALRILYCIVICDRVALQQLAKWEGVHIAEIRQAVQQLEALGLVDHLVCQSGVRYHSRFPELSFLANEALHELGADTVTELRRSHLIELSDDDADAAAAELIEVGELAAAEDVLVTHFIAVMTPSIRLTEAVRRVPKADIAKHPVLSGVLLLMELADPRTPQSTLDRLHLQVRQSAMRDLESGAPHVAIVSLAGLIMAQRMRGSGSETLKLSAELERRLETAQEKDLDYIRSSLSVIHAVGAFASVMNGNAQMGERGFQKTYEAALAAGNESEQIRGLSGLAMVAAMSGNVEEARSLNARTVELVLASGVSGPVFARVNRQTANALVAVDDRNPLQLQSILEPLEATLPSLEQAAVLIYAETQMLRMTEGPLAALKSLETRVQQVKQARRIPPYLMTELLVLKANLLLYMGGYAAAKAILDRVPQRMRVASLSTARLALFEGDADEALRLAEMMLEQEGSDRFLNQGRIIAAVAAWELGARQDAENYLVALGSSLLHSGGVNVLGTVPHEPLKTAVETLLSDQTSNVLKVKDDVPLDTQSRPALEHIMKEVESLPKWLRPERFESLSQSEHRILQELSTGASRDAIAKKLFISTNTVKFHLRGIYRKLGATNRWEALRRAEDLELIEATEQSPDS